MNPFIVILELLLHLLGLTFLSKLEAEQEWVNELEGKIGELEVECQKYQILNDGYYDWADKLAYSIADEDIIGVHGSGNNPWKNALAISNNCKDDEDE
jgi:hypothetical protein